MPLEVYYKMLGKVIYDTFSMVMEKKKRMSFNIWSSSFFMNINVGCYPFHISHEAIACSISIS